MQGFHYENRNSNTFLVYSMQPGDELDTFSLGMVSNNKIPGLLPLLFTQMNNERQFLFNVTSKVSLRQYISGRMTREKCVKALEGITEAFLACGDYMLNTSALLTDPDHIFMNVGTGEAALVCLPTCGREELDDMPRYFRDILCRMIFSETESIEYPAIILNFLNRGGNFSLPEFKSFLQEIKSKPADKTPQIDLLSSSDCEDNTSSTSDDKKTDHLKLKQSDDRSSSREKKESAEKKRGLLSLLEHFINGKNTDRADQHKVPEAGVGFAIPGLSVFPSANSVYPALSKDKPQPPKEQVFFGSTTYLEPDSESEQTMLLKDCGLPAEDPEPYLIRLKTNEKVMIRGEIFKIGKERSYVDYFVESNASVSRSHADIVRREDGFRIIDNNSTNHTYLNGRLIPSNEEISLEDGASILLGNEEFTFHIT